MPPFSFWVDPAEEVAMLQPNPELPGRRGCSSSQSAAGGTLGEEDIHSLPPGNLETCQWVSLRLQQLFAGTDERASVSGCTPPLG